MALRLSQLLTHAESGAGHIAKHHKTVTAADFEAGIEELALVLKADGETFESAFRKAISDDPRGQKLYEASLVAREAALFRGDHLDVRIAAKKAAETGLDAYVAKAARPDETKVQTLRRLFREDAEFARLYDATNAL